LAAKSPNKWKRGLDVVVEGEAQTNTGQRSP
jgi:hypothetical protein